MKLVFIDIFAHHGVVANRNKLCERNKCTENNNL